MDFLEGGDSKEQSPQQDTSASTVQNVASKVIGLLGGKQALIGVEPALIND